jgi:N-acetylglucosaminyldiphosphoundecaprenol N-acetyl-beta-D-mannosaminyltransferase
LSTSPSAIPDHARENILGIKVSALSLPRAVDIVAAWVENRVRPPRYVCVRDAHGIVRGLGDPELRRIHNQAGMVTSDGMPLVWILRRRGHKDVTRVYGPDLMHAIMADARLRGRRHFFYGGLPGIPELLAERLVRQFPGLTVAGTLSPPFGEPSAEEDAALVAQVNAAKPDIVWVGLSTPKQERWMASRRDRIDAAALMGVGAAFDFHAGVKPQAPLWMQRNGLEWIFRLATEPRRLAGRYLKTVPTFAFLVLLQELGLKKFPVDDQPGDSLGGPAARS